MSNLLERALNRSLRFLADYGGITFGVAFFFGLIAVMACAFWAVWSGTFSWVSTIEDPTERGLAYVAVAIAFHALFGKSDVDVKVNGADAAAKGPVQG